MSDYVYQFDIWHETEKMWKLNSKHVAGILILEYLECVLVNAESAFYLFLS